MIPLASDLMFLAPERFVLLAVPLLLAGLYLLRQRRRRAYVVRFTDPELLDSVAPRRPGLRRHLVAAVYLAASAMLVVAAARPAQPTASAIDPAIVARFIGQQRDLLTKARALDPGLAARTIMASRPATACC